MVKPGETVVACGVETPVARAAVADSNKTNYWQIVAHSLYSILYLESF